MDLRSASNRQKTLLRKLNRKKYRQEEQLFLLEGARAVEQLLDNGTIRVEALFFDESQQYWHQQRWRDRAEQVNAFSMAEDIFADVSDTDNPQGVLALCRIPDEATTNELVSREGLIIAFDGVQDPGNLGTIIRTASWFGVAGMISGKGTVDLFHPKVVRGTAGATGVIPYRNGDLAEELLIFESAGWPIYLLDAGEDSQPLTTISSLTKGVVVVGNEAHGIDKQLISGSRHRLKISSPHVQQGVESLNAAVAGSIALYDLSAKLQTSTEG
jgi:TrmH family RNA methyltransferase